MKNNGPTLEHAIYALALAIAIGLRFVHLGAVPLSDFEAAWALQALHVVQGIKPAIGPNPAYVHLTALLFFIFGSSNFLACFWPALTGCSLVLGAWALRPHIGRVPALILAFGLAVDPGLVAMSHLAGGPMLALAFLAWTALMGLRGRRAAAGFFAGMALLSGPSVWLGGLGIALAWWIGRIFEKKIPRVQEQDPDGQTPAKSPAPIKFGSLKPALYWVLATVLVGGSLFFFSPLGLPAVASSFWTFLSGWLTLSDVQVWRLFLALPAYEILPLALGIAGIVRAAIHRDVPQIRLGVWAAVALLLALMYPGKQTGDLVWAIVPLWVLAAMELGRHFDFAGINPWEVMGTSTAVVAFAVFGWLNLASITNMQWGTDMVQTRLWLLGAVMLLIVLSLLLVATGWSQRVARLGGVWAGVLLLTLFTIAMATGAGGLRQPLTLELWQPEPRTGRVDIIVKVASQLSDLNRGVADQLPLTILGVDSPALDWSFRDWQVQDVDQLATDASPELVISPSADLSLAAQYRGEPLVLHETGNWYKATPQDWLRWFVYRQMTMLQSNVILWVRNDLMLDTQDEPAVTP